MALNNNAANIQSLTASPLDVYTELATWTPVITGSTTAGAGTYTTQTGYYTVIGSLVIFTLNVVWTAHTGTGNMLITGLPQTAINQGNYVTEQVVSVQNISLPALGLYVVGEIVANTTQIALLAVRTASTTAAVAMSGTGTVKMTGVYINNL